MQNCCNGQAIEMTVETVVTGPRVVHRHVPKFLTDAEQFVKRGWIPTYTGKRFSLARPDPVDVDIIDIAVALSRLPRFTGQTKKFYSVAQHSVLASLNCPEYSMSALMHDSGEAYTNDITRPLKIGLGEQLRQIEDAVYHAIAKRFGFIHWMPGEVKAVDNRLLATEARDLCVGTIPFADIAGGCFPPYEEPIVPWSMHESMMRFLYRFQELSNQPIDWDKVPSE